MNINLIMDIKKKVILRNCNKNRKKSTDTHLFLIIVLLSFCHVGKKKLTFK